MRNYTHLKDRMPLNHGVWALVFWSGFSLFLVIFIFDFNSAHARDVKVCDISDAKEALKLMKDWLVWMAGIQTATLAALGILAKDGVLTLKVARTQTWLLMATVIFTLLALFFSAWLLTASSSIMLRLSEAASENGSLDFYNYPLYHLQKKDSLLTVAFFVTCNHWFWGASIIAFGLLTISVALSRQQRSSRRI